MSKPSKQRTVMKVESHPVWLSSVLHSVTWTMICLLGRSLGYVFSAKDFWLSLNICSLELSWGRQRGFQLWRHDSPNSWMANPGLSWRMRALGIEDISLRKREIISWKYPFTAGWADIFLYLHRPPEMESVVFLVVDSYVIRNKELSLFHLK